MERSDETPRRPILVVDDEGDARDGLKDVLEAAGYEVCCLRNGEEALAYLRKNEPPAAVLLDLFMPVMNGWQFVRQVRAMPNLEALPIVLVTGQAPHWGYPVQQVLRKPIDPEELLRVVRDLVRTDPGIAA